MTTRSEYLAFIQRAYDLESHRLEEEITRWRADRDLQSPLFGYMPPGWPLALAAVASFLYQQRGDPSLAMRARDVLLAHRQWVHEVASAEITTQRPEYAAGVPPLEPVFQPLVFVAACERIRDRLSSEEWRALGEMIAETLRLVRLFPEWGAHNRAMLRAAGLALAARALPEHPDAAWWAELADELAEETWGRWSIEDAMLYQPHWLRALFTYAEARGRPGLEEHLQPRAHLKMAVQLLTPMSTLPDFGDSRWMSSQLEWLACLEWGARAYRDPTMKWAAARIWDTLKDKPTMGAAAALIAAWNWCQDDVPLREPGPTLDALDDLVAKKIVFRTGWDAEATYACLNYRDEGDYGLVARDYLRTTLAVSAEKMHHGHADEGSVILLMSGGTVLLHDGGYRERPPDGVYRADIYHNRLVWRPVRKPAPSGLLSFLWNGGDYHRVRAERLYWTRLCDVEIGRVRVTDEAQGLAWDRSAFFLPEPDCFVFIDSVRALRAQAWTLSALWWTTDVLARGVTWCDTCVSRIGEWENRQGRSLLIIFPQSDGASITVEPYRRNFQEQTVVAKTWSGHLGIGDTVSLVSVLWAHPSGDGTSSARAAAVQVLDGLPASRGTGVRITWGGVERILATLHDLTVGWVAEDVRPRYVAAKGNIVYGPLASDAAFAYVRCENGRLWAGFVNGTYLRYQDRVLYEGLPHAMFQEDRTARPGVPARFRWQGETELV
jgi:hypothetical protein